MGFIFQKNEARPERLKQVLDTQPKEAIKQALTAQPFDHNALHLAFDRDTPASIIKLLLKDIDNSTLYEILSVRDHINNNTPLEIALRPRGEPLKAEYERLCIELFEKIPDLLYKRSISHNKYILEQHFVYNRLFDLSVKNNYPKMTKMLIESLAKAPTLIIAQISDPRVFQALLDSFPDNESLILFLTSHQKDEKHWKQYLDFLTQPYPYFFRSDSIQSPLSQLLQRGLITHEGFINFLTNTPKKSEQSILERLVYKQKSIDGRDAHNNDHQDIQYTQIINSLNSHPDQLFKLLTSPSVFINSPTPAGGKISLIDKFIAQASTHTSIMNGTVADATFEHFMQALTPENILTLFQKIGPAKAAEVFYFHFHLQTRQERALNHYSEIFKILEAFHRAPETAENKAILTNIISSPYGAHILRVLAFKSVEQTDDATSIELIHFIFNALQNNAQSIAHSWGLKLSLLSNNDFFTFKVIEILEKSENHQYFLEALITADNNNDRCYAANYPDQEVGTLPLQICRDKNLLINILKKVQLIRPDVENYETNIALLCNKECSRSALPLLGHFLTLCQNQMQDSNTLAPLLTAGTSIEDIQICITFLWSHMNAGTRARFLAHFPHIQAAWFDAALTSEILVPMLRRPPRIERARRNHQQGVVDRAEEQRILEDRQRAHDTVLHQTADGHSLWLLQTLNPSDQFYKTQKDKILQVIHTEITQLLGKPSDSISTQNFLAGAFVFCSSLSEPPTTSELTEAIGEHPILKSLFEKVKRNVTANAFYGTYAGFRNGITQLNLNQVFLLTASHLPENDNGNFRELLREIGSNLLVGKQDTACAPGAYNKIVHYGTLKVEDWWVFSSDEKKMVIKHALNQLFTEVKPPAPKEPKDFTKWEQDCLAYAKTHRMTTNIARTGNEVILLNPNHLKSLIQYMWENPEKDISKVYYIDEIKKTEQSEATDILMEWGSVEEGKGAPLKEFVRKKLSILKSPTPEQINSWANGAFDHFIESLPYLQGVVLDEHSKAMPRDEAFKQLKSQVLEHWGTLDITLEIIGDYLTTTIGNEIKARDTLTNTPAEPTINTPAPSIVFQQDLTPDQKLEARLKELMATKTSDLKILNLQKTVRAHNRKNNNRKNHNQNDLQAITPEVIAEIKRLASGNNDGQAEHWPSLGLKF